MSLHDGEWTTSDGVVIREGEPLTDGVKGLGQILEIVSGTLTSGEVHGFKEGWESHFPNVVREGDVFVARGGMCKSHDPIAKGIQPYFSAFLREKVDA